MDANSSPTIKLHILLYEEDELQKTKYCQGLKIRDP